MNGTDSVATQRISRLDVPDSESLDQDVREIVSAFAGDNWVRALTTAPNTARRFTTFMQTFFADSGMDLSLRDREMVAVAVSKENNCGYCVAHHTHVLGEVTGDHKMARKYSLEPRFVPLSERDHAMIEFARKLTRSPRDVQDEDFDKLRSHDISDQMILEIMEVTGYFNFANRMFMGLGCSIDERLFSN